jgi:hypothetical protein
MKPEIYELAKNNIEAMVGDRQPPLNRVPANKHLS